jgi:hypothetical protein
MFGYRAAATDLVEQAALIGRVEASFCDFTSFLSLTDEQRTGGRVSVGGDYITEVRVGKGPFNDREVFVFQPITNIDLTRGAQACKMMLLGLPLVRRNVSSTTPALTRLAFLLCAEHVPQLGGDCVKKTRKRHAVRKMKVGPSEPPCRRRLQTALSCFGPKGRGGER